MILRLNGSGRRGRVGSQVRGQVASHCEGVMVLLLHFQKFISRIVPSSTTVRLCRSTPRLRACSFWGLSLRLGRCGDQLIRRVWISAVLPGEEPVDCRRPFIDGEYRRAASANYKFELTKRALLK
eukprot:IDg4862t1